MLSSANRCISGTLTLTGPKQTTAPKWCSGTRSRVSSPTSSRRVSLSSRKWLSGSVTYRVLSSCTLRRRRGG